MLKELKNHSFPSVEIIVVKLTVKNMQKYIFSIFWAINQYKPVSEIPVQ